MQVTIVHVRVRPEHVEEFIDATRANHEGSVREEGNLRFDVLQDPDHPTSFVLYEAYVDADAARAHKETPHYRDWAATVADWLDGPRTRETYVGLLPELPPAP